MTLRPLLPAILLALVMSIVVGVLAVGRASGLTLALAVGLFVLQIVFATLRVNAPFWNGEASLEEDESPAVASVWRNTVLAALVYAWGATAMMALYSLSSLVWRHWWQYGAAMGVIAAAILVYAMMLDAGRPSLRTKGALDTLMWLTGVQGVAMSIAFAYIVFYDKLLTPRDDWAANYIFAAGSATIAVLSLVAIMTYRNIKTPTAAA
jgi:hypothetical protein